MTITQKIINEIKKKGNPTSRTHAKYTLNKNTIKLITEFVAEERRPW